MSRTNKGASASADRAGGPSGLSQSSLSQPKALIPCAKQANKAHSDGSMTIDNASVQRLLDYGLLHYTDEGWFVGRWPKTNTPSREGSGDE